MSKSETGLFYRAKEYVKDYIDSYLTSPFKKFVCVLILLIAELLGAYIIAVMDAGADTGIFGMDITISGLFRHYCQPGTGYPWSYLFIYTGCILFIATLVIWKNGTPPGGRNFQLSKNNTYGSGREITQKELEQVANLSGKDATVTTILGQIDDKGRKVISAKPGAMPNDNMLVFGPPGCGKSTSYVRPYITQAVLRRESICVSDTKGEVYATTAEFARKHGYRVLRLNLKDPAHSDGWHVLKELRNDDVRALIFAQTVMANTGNPKDQFAAPQESLLKACCLYQERTPDLPDSQRTLYNAFAMLLQGAEALDATITAAFNTYGACMQVVADSYSTFLQGSPNLRGNIITGLANRLQVLASPPVREMTSTDEIDFASLGEVPTILYISMSDQHQTMSFLASLAFSFAFLDLVELADSKPKQRLDIPVHFLMEEFGNLGRIPNIDKYLSTARSRGISINLVVQSLAQLTGIYEENLTETILADCATWLCLGCNDRATADLLEWRSGEATIRAKTERHAAMEPPFQLAHQNSVGDGRRNFYTSNDIMKIKARKEALIIWQQMDSLKAYAFPIFQHHEHIAGNIKEVSAESLIPLSNKKAKKIFRDWEDERVESFRVWMENGGDPLLGYPGLGGKTKGPARKEPLPDIIPIHTLERMALAEAEGKKYDPKTDPDNPAVYQVPKKPGETGKGKNVVADGVWDLTGIQFVTTAQPEPPKAPEVPKTPEPPKAPEVPAPPVEKPGTEPKKTGTPTVTDEKAQAAPPPQPPQPPQNPQADKPKPAPKPNTVPVGDFGPDAKNAATRRSYAQSRGQKTMEDFFGLSSQKDKNKPEPPRPASKLAGSHDKLPPKPEE